MNDDGGETSEVSLKEIWEYDNSAKVRTEPPSIALRSDVIHLKLSPTSSHVAVSTVDDQFSLFSYDISGCPEALRFRLPRRSCVSACVFEFTGDGTLLFAGCSDGYCRIYCTRTGSLKRKLQCCISAAVSAILPLSSRYLAVGDELGCVQVINYRSRKQVMRETRCEDTITDLICDAQQHYLVSSSSEGTITAYSLKCHQVVTQCDMYKAPLNSMTFIKGDTQLAVGMASKSGQINLFNWKNFAQHVDAFKNHPCAITCLAAVTDSVLAVGYEDGFIRACHVTPHKYFGVIGRHSNLPVECLAVSTDSSLLVSCGHDNKVHFWNISYLLSEEYEVSKMAWKKRKKLGDCRKLLPSSRIQPAATFFQDLPMHDQGTFFWS